MLRASLVYGREVRITEPPVQWLLDNILMHIFLFSTNEKVVFSPLELFAICKVDQNVVRVKGAFLRPE